MHETLRSLCLAPPKHNTTWHRQPGAGRQTAKAGRAACPACRPVSVWGLTSQEKVTRSPLALVTPLLPAAAGADVPPAVCCMVSSSRAPPAAWGQSAGCLMRQNLQLGAMLCWQSDVFYAVPRLPVQLPHWPSAACSAPAGRRLQHCSAQRDAAHARQQTLGLQCGTPAARAGSNALLARIGGCRTSAGPPVSYSTSPTCGARQRAVPGAAASRCCIVALQAPTWLHLSASVRMGSWRQCMSPLTGSSG